MAFITNLERASLAKVPRTTFPASMRRARRLGLLALVITAICDVMLAVPMSWLFGPDPWSPRELVPATASCALFSLPIPVLILMLLRRYERTWRDGTLVDARVLSTAAGHSMLAFEHPGLGPAVTMCPPQCATEPGGHVVVVSPRGPLVLVVVSHDEVVRGTAFRAPASGATPTTGP
jgi:hypothetical protein